MDIKNRYDAVAIALHWTIAALLIFMLFFGEELMEVDEGGSVLSASAHVSIGILIFILSLLRLAWRLLNPPPALPDSMAAWEKAASNAVHVLFYVLMIGLPLSGWLAFPGFLHEEPTMAGVRIFQLFPVPDAPSAGLRADAVHSLLGKIGIALLALHVIAALKHQFVDRDDILRRMLPWRGA